MLIQPSRFDDPALLHDLERGQQLQRPLSNPARLVEQIVHRARSGAGVDFDAYEAFLGENDLVEVNFLERGLMAARTVCRINVAQIAGDGSDWGTGFLIGPRLLLTNAHVLPTPQDAARATIEFGYELDGEGRLRRTQRFALTPALGWISSPRDQLDYTIVAIAEHSDEGVALSDFGFLRLDPRTGKIDVGNYVTIVQHPGSATKRVSLRENKVVKYGDPGDARKDDFLWYSSDTAPGSSGAPVCTDAWQVVCLHHAGVPVRRTVDGAEHWLLHDGETVPAEMARQLPGDRICWVANEGVRISRLLADVEARTSADPALRSPLIAALLDDASGLKPFDGTIAGMSIVGPPLVAPSAAPVAEPAVADEKARTPRRSVRSANYLDGRGGYEEDFLGTAVPLPIVGADALAHGPVAKVRGTTDDVLRYVHFSIILNAAPERRMAFFTAVNIDGKRWTKLTRGNDRWYYDPRIPEELQNGDELYGSEPVAGGNYFDRGHLVRRLDPVWGDIREAAQANDDTFYWTNCSPQYKGFNQGQELWQGLENFLLYNSDQEDVRTSVFTGPVFRTDDEEHRGILIPQYFWKVVVVADQAGRLLSSGYLVSQREWVLDIPFERLPVGPNSDRPAENFQVPIARIAAETGLAFDPVVLAADVYTGPASGRALRSLADVEHPRR